MKTIRKIFSLLLVLFILPMVSCDKKETAEIEVPKNISLTANNNEVMLKVYDTKSESIKEMNLEDYLKGVLAGEMYNSWPLEALKAQAILARTYTLYFLQNLSSKYEGADISNDISEAQAYDESAINEQIERAIDETKGQVIMKDGELIEAWFHANSGGTTTTAKFGLNYLGEENYTKVTDSPETSENSENYEWTAVFTKSEMLSALRKMGVSISTISTMSIGEMDDSGRAITLKVGSSECSANTLRKNLGSTKMKSTLITNIIVSSSNISISGKGYGHGVGMSQWGAKIMAEKGKNADDIIKHYFNDVTIVIAEFKNK